ncbi:MAG: hypothetical protein ACRBB0_25050 [Pelagimonas sp.]|uniref:hypothetical protein n=1 Tax=Pelagimonas sp. TaxID=2073170 RepID=UPI003D6A741D
MSIVMRVGALIVIGLLAGCAEFPELEAGETPGVANAPYPKLVPLETLLVADAPVATVEMVGQVEGRAGGLRARAARLQTMRVGSGAGIAQRVARLRQKAAQLRAQ